MTSLKQLFDLSGQVALVTGGSRGLGEEIAEGLAEAGASLMLLARREQWLSPAVDAMKQRGFRCEGALCDVSKPAEIDAVVKRDRRHLRPDRYPGQQRRRHLGRSRRDHAFRQMAAGARRESYRRIPLLASLRAGDDQAQVRAHHQCCFDCRLEEFHAARHSLRGICVVESRTAGPDARTGRPVGAPQHPRERHRARASSPRA